jgi:outer membrane protein assembly factor BamB
MSDFRDRRSVLRAGAALCSLTVAGCLGIGGSDGSNDGDGPGDDSDADGAEPDDTGGNESGTDGGNDTDGEDPGGDDTDWETIEAWPQLQYDAQNTGYVHAEAPTDVEQLWRVETDEGVDTSPVVVDGTVYIRDKSGTVYAIQNGDIQWKTDVGIDGSTEGTPVIHDDVLVAPIEGGLAGLERDGGNVRWEYPISDQPGRLMLIDETVFVPNQDRELYAVEAATGKKRWSVTANGPRGAGFFGTPAIYRDEIIVPRGPGFSGEGTPQIRALNIEEGWQRPMIETDVPINTGVAIRDDTFYLGADDGIYAFDPESEEKLWHHETEKEVRAMVAISPDAVFAMTTTRDPTESNLRCVEKSHGEERWTAEVAPSFTTGPIVVGNQVASYRSSGEVVGWGTERGKEVWEKQLEIGSFEKFAYADGIYYGGSIRGKVYAWE